MLLTEIATLDTLLHAHTAVLGRDFTAYRNHTYRVVNLCVAQSSADPEPLEKIAIAAAFHDLGIWTDGTFDYLPPSVRLANAYLVQAGKAAWAPEISEMILQHHKISPYRGHPGWLAEPFRRADWIDVSRGLIMFGLPRTLLREIYATWPSAGFSPVARQAGDHASANPPLESAADDEALTAPGTRRFSIFTSTVYSGSTS